jgi:signal peptidase I
MSFKEGVQRIWKFLHEDSWQSWIVSIILIIVLVKGVFFPTLAWITGTQLPLVVVESCSMYHGQSFDEWWQDNSDWYESHNISYESYKSFSLKNGLNKGDIVFVWGKSNYKLGDIIIFNAQAQHPLIHRIIEENPFATKGDHNSDQLRTNNNGNRIDETDIARENILGKAVGKIPYLGWIKLIFFEPFKDKSERWFCSVKQNI